MFDALRQRLANAVHHGDGGLHPLLVRNLHDVEPAIGTRLLLRNLIAHALHENLATATRDRVEPRLLKLADDVPRVHAIQPGPEVHLAGAEAVHVNGVVPLDVAQQIQIPLERDVRIVPALHQDLYAAERLGLVDLGTDLLVAQCPSLAVLGSPREGTEAAIGDADVGVVEGPAADLPTGSL